MIALLFMSQSPAMCIGQPPRTFLWQESVGPKTPIVIGSTWGSAEDLAGRLRVRGPDATLIPIRAESLGLDVRLIPETTWPDGSITLEERGDFDATSKRVTGLGIPVTSAWFPLRDLPVAKASPPLDPPGEVTWTRQPRMRRSDVRGEVVAPEGTRWLSLEVQGVGAISRRWPMASGPTLLWSGALTRCNDTGQLQPVPAGGDLTVRAVAHGDGGASAASSWTVLGPDGGPPAGRWADTSALTSWSPIAGTEDTAPVVSDNGACASLVELSRTETEVPPQTRVTVDDRGYAHTIRGGPAVHIDGQRVDGLSSPPRHLAVLDGSLYAVVGRSPLEIVRIEGDAVTAKAALDGVRSVQLDAEGALLVTLVDAEGKRWVHALDGDLERLREPEEILHPIAVDKSGASGLVVNGRPVEAGQINALFVGDDRVAVSDRSGADGSERRIHVFSPTAEPLLTVRLPDDARVGRVVADEAGVVYTYRSAGQSVIEGRNFDGSERFVAELPSVPNQLNRSESRRAWGDRVLVRTREHTWVQDGKAASAPLPVQRETVVSFDPKDPDVLVLSTVPRATPEGDAPTREDVRLRCSAKVVGVPPHWTR